MNITEATKQFVGVNQTIINDYASKYYPNVEPKILQTQVAIKFIKVWVYRFGRKESIHAFVDKVSGDIFMPAGLNKPAKHARGNVFSASHGSEALSDNGMIKYLK